MDNKDKIILHLCADIGSDSKPYRDAGYDVRCIGSDIGVENYSPPMNVYGVIANPPCTHFASSGARWWEGKGDKAIIEGLIPVMHCLRIIAECSPKFWVLENPVGRLKHYIGNPKMYYNPCEYGDPYTKKTCLWGVFNIPDKNPVEPEFIVAKNGKRFSKMHWYTGGKSEKTKIIRSTSPKGFTKAFFEANK